MRFDVLISNWINFEGECEFLALICVWMLNKAVVLPKIAASCQHKKSFLPHHRCFDQNFNLRVRWDCLSS